jgi:hypothetical protein
MLLAAVVRRRDRKNIMVGKTYRGEHVLYFHLNAGAKIL